jgi:hypothetical protein
MIRTTDALESDCKGKLVHHDSAKRLGQVATAGAHRRQDDRSYLLTCDPIKTKRQALPQIPNIWRLGFRRNLLQEAEQEKE